jgi:hypothetical protein
VPTTGASNGRRGVPALVVANRFAAAIIGGFAFTYGFVALATVAGFALGLPFFEAWSLTMMLAILVYLGAVLWGFVARRTIHVWAVLGGGGCAMAASAWALAPLVG